MFFVHASDTFPVPIKQSALKMQHTRQGRARHATQGSAKVSGWL
jgi:hypothetical protein